VIVLRPTKASFTTARRTQEELLARLQGKPL
jgi:hypothetical protein